MTAETMGFSYSTAAPHQYVNPEVHIPWHRRTVVNHRSRGRFLHGTDETHCIEHFTKKDTQLERLYSLGHAFVDLYDEFDGTLPIDLKSLLEKFEEGSDAKKANIKLYSWAKREVWGGPNHFLADECLNTILRNNPAVIWNSIPEPERDYIIFQWRGMKEAFVTHENLVEILPQ